MPSAAACCRDDVQVAAKQEAACSDEYAAGELTSYGKNEASKALSAIVHLPELVELGAVDNVHLGRRRAGAGDNVSGRRRRSRPRSTFTPPVKPGRRRSS